MHAFRVDQQVAQALRQGLASDRDITRPPLPALGPAQAARRHGPAPGVRQAAVLEKGSADSAEEAQVHTTSAPAVAVSSPEAEVLQALSRIEDPDLRRDIVSCGFVQDLQVDTGQGTVSLTLELTTPACPVKDHFQKTAVAYVEELPWVTKAKVEISAQPPASTSGRAGGLAGVRHVVAVSSCKGGVGKSTVAVNLAYTLAQMGARVGLFDADVYGPSLPSMVSPAQRVMAVQPDTRRIVPTEYEGVKLVSFGFAGQGSAIMRGPMVSGLVQQLLTTAEWGELDYLVMDFPPGTGDIQLTICQSVEIDAAVIVTTPQQLAFVDVVKGIRMFARMAVPCAAVVENMSYFEAPDGTRYQPFGQGSGERLVRDYGLPHLVQLPIVAELSAAGDGGVPLVVSQPASPSAEAFMELGSGVVREVAKLREAPRNSARYDAAAKCFVADLSGLGEEAPVRLDPAVVRAADTGAKLAPGPVGGLEADGPGVPAEVRPLGNYAVLIVWEGGPSQVASFELLQGLDRLQ